MKTDQQTFHNWLVLARLITISEGATEMKPKHFEAAVELDQQRNERIPPKKQ